MEELSFFLVRCADVNLSGGSKFSENLNDVFLVLEGRKEGMESDFRSLAGTQRRGKQCNVGEYGRSCV
ncbi:hypothetical protein ANTQUA_LOCUS1192 [Anthophora quadrimaculata]